MTNRVMTTLCRYCRAITWRADGVCGRCSERCCWPTALCPDCAYDVAREERRG